MVQIITRYDYEAQAKVAPGSYFDPKKKSDRSMTNQSDMDAADVNKIMARAENGVIDPTIISNRVAQFGDFSKFGSYYEMLCSVRRAEQVFASLPAAVRNRFDNDPQQLIDFLNDSKNDKEAVKLGFKSEDVLKTALADDGVTHIYPEERESLDALKAAQAAKGSAGKPADGQAVGAAGSGA